MHDLIPLGPALPGALTAAEIDATMAYAAAEKALATGRRMRATDWRDFAAWCLSRGATALPAHQGIVAAYLSHLAEAGLKASTIVRRAAAIGHRHKLAGHEPPTNTEGVKATRLQRIGAYIRFAVAPPHEAEKSEAGAEQQDAVGFGDGRGLGQLR